MTVDDEAQDPRRTSPTADVRAAELTGSGRGGVATIGVAGRRWADVVNRYFAPAAGPVTLQENRVYYGQWRSGRITAPGESVVVTPLGNYAVEVHCHGGRAAVVAILSDLAAAGAEVLSWQQWIEHQEAASPLIAEARQVLAETVTQRTAAIALDQVRGAFRDQLRGWIDALRHGVPWDVVRTDVQEVLQRCEVGLHLAHPWNVVLAGAPNVGKSSLLNALLGYRRAITFDAPGTTRDVVAAETVIDGWPLRISDTAGMRHSEDHIERHGVQSARRAAQAADVVVLVTAAGPHKTTAAGDAGHLQALHDSRRVIHVLNKVDLLDQTAPPVDEDWVQTVAVSGRGIDDLARRIVAALVPNPPAPGAAVPVTPRQTSCLQRVLAAPSADEALARLYHVLRR